MTTLPPPKTKIAIYARYSTNLQTFKSAEDREALCRDYATRQGWNVVRSFDAERTGRATLGRAGFHKMMAAADRDESSLMSAEERHPIAVARRPNSAPSSMS